MGFQNMFSMVKSVGIFGIDSYMLNIEADVSGGLPCFDVVGLPDTAVKESRDRVSRDKKLRIHISDRQNNGKSCS